jgi:hypothetical protein
LGLDQESGQRKHEGIAAAPQKCFEDDMVNTQQSVCVGDAIITAVVKAFHRHGTQEGEISELLVTARVLEPTVDEHFQSKEDLVVAYLKDRHATWMHWLRRP